MRRVGTALLAVIAAAGCGRLGYHPDATASDGAASDDAGDSCTDGGASCERLVPSNVGTGVGIDTGSADVVVGADPYESWIVETTTGAITAMRPDSEIPRIVRPAGTGPMAGIVFQLVAQSGDAPPLGVFAVRRFEVESGATLTAVGGSPLVILAGVDVTIAGSLIARADETAPGPGGGRGGAGGGGNGSGAGGGAGGVDALPAPGGGGASFGGPGGTDGEGTPAGEAYGTPELVPLYGGSGGGGGASAGGNGGAGGGAVHLAAADRVDISGSIDVCGTGGQGGQVEAGSGGGGGGGSGGAILLESPIVVVTGFLGANGGAGGQGTQERWVTQGVDGSPGDAVRAPALGSGSLGNGGGGGDGSSAMGMASPGATSSYAGGGGGGAGRIRINTRSGSEPFDRGVLPLASSGLTTIGRATFETP